MSELKHQTHFRSIMVQRELEGIDMGLEGPQDEIRLLLVGDRGTGKTSLIYTLVNDDFDENVPARMASITVPAEVFSEKVPLHIVDYSDREQNYDELIDQIRDANVICVVYTAGDDESLSRVASLWLPTIRKCQSDNAKPIMLVANKVDLYETSDTLDRVTAIINEFLEIEAFIEVSARTQKNVVELFSSAQKAVLYPLAPLYDPQSRVLTRRCRNALINIFKLCDLDGDGLLSDHELNSFQLDCFGTPLQKDALDDLKSIIKQSTMDGIVDDCLTQTGFLFLHTLSIEKGLHDFTWQVVRKFGYENQIKAEGEDSRSVEIDDQSEDFSHTARSLPSSQDLSSSEDDTIDTDDLSHLDPSWVTEHSTYIKAGLGLTLVTLASMLALKYLVTNSAKSAN